MKSFKRIVIELLGVFLLFCVIVVAIVSAAYFGLMSSSDSLSINHALANTILFKIAFEIVYSQDLLGIPILGVLAITPLTAIVVFIVWAIARGPSLLNSSIDRASIVGSPLMRVQVAFVAAGILIEYATGLYIGRAVFDGQQILSQWNLTIYCIVIGAVLHLSLSMAALSGSLEHSNR